MYAFLDKTAGFLARTTALIGGIVLLLLVAMTCLSITGRSLSFIGLNQIKGDFELMELGVGFVIFSFLPWAQYSGGHARVDLFATVMPLWMNRLADVASDLLLLAIAVIVGWRLWLGMLDKKSYGETTFILHWPVWEAYLSGLLGMSVFVIVALFCTLRSTRSLLGGTP